MRVVWFFGAYGGKFDVGVSVFGGKMVGFAVLRKGEFCCVKHKGCVS